MLNQLHIHNLAIVSSMELEMQGGLTVLTGETGAGKSILIDALGLALGERADKSMIRSGSERAEITAQFDISKLPEANDWLKERVLDDDEGACILRRSLNKEGRSRTFINGRSVPLQQLQELGTLLVEIHGQHAHQSLLKPSHQRRLLDAYGGHIQLCEKLAQQYKEYQNDLNRLQKLTTEADERASRLDLLHFQSHELNGLNLSKEELISIDQEYIRLSHQEQLRESCTGIITNLDGDQPSFRSHLSRSVEKLRELEPLDDTLKDPKEMLDSALIQLDESLGYLRSYLSDIELNPIGLQQLEDRLGAIHDMARKYRVKPEQLIEKLQQIEAEIADLEQIDIKLTKLASQVSSQQAAFHKLGKELSKKRKSAAKRLSEEITQAMQKLGMPGGVFAVTLHPVTPEKASAQGMEQVDFQVSANPGIPQQPLNRVASGGELSRISLAIQVATIRYGATPTLVFDEVDVGIGGSIAEIVGQMLRKLASTRQILCVTHLPQVAAQAMHHFQVQKTTQKQMTHTTITRLGKGERIQEIARMLGGVKITKQTLAHAEEMVNLASNS
jgi:DNA repair protein RecN (Recombination protein N)